MELLFGGLKNMFSLLGQWLAIVSGIPFTFSVWQLLLLFLLAAVWFVSGLYAADIAERRGKSPWIHFVLALILPWLYPLLLKIILKPEPGSADDVVRQKKDNAAKAEKEKEKAEEKAIRAEQEELAREVLDPTRWSKKRVDQLCRTANGPFVCTLRDGRTLTGIRIRETTPEVVIFELPDPSGGDPMAVRFPYDKITSIDTADSKS